MTAHLVKFCSRVELKEIYEDRGGESEEDLDAVEGLENAVFDDEGRKQVVVGLQEHVLDIPEDLGPV